MSPRSCASSILSTCCALILAATGCPKKGGNAASQLTEAPDLAEATGQSKCGVRRSAAKPLVVEWPAADRAALEARARSGLIAVRYEGCEMEVLTTCSAAGNYAYLGLTQKREAVKIKTADELYANLPIGAAGLEAKLERSGQLNVDMVIVGRKEADKHKFNERDLDGRCDEATHVVTGLTVGAFSFYTGAAAEVGAGAKIGNIGAGAKSSANQEVLKQDGDEESCGVATSEDEDPPEGCGALLRVEVVPVDRIFATSRPTNVTPTGTTSSGQTDTGPEPDPKLDKKIRTAKILTATGYVSLLAGTTLAVVGAAFLRASPENEDPGSDRQKAITRVRASQGLLYGGLGLAAGGLVLALWANTRLKRLQKQRRAAVAPTFGPGLAGLGVRGSF